MKKIILAFAILALMACNQKNEQNVNPANDKVAITELLKTYAQSVDLADTDLAATIWDTNERVIFIHPRGDEFGWEAVKENFYKKTMGERFSKRKLKIFNERIEFYGNIAVVFFHWEFQAVLSHDLSPLTTKGRETQVLTKTNQGWKIIHVHYSGMPVSGEREGF
ncbi:MAG: nuclear transport factor 2 family protein [Capnocytophaga sp.]|nr:nuclear transport factor 2 family protein [Capnocytophaga sp.]